jgi:hypothetical protein
MPTPGKVEYPKEYNYTRARESKISPKVYCQYQGKKNMTNTREVG